MSTYNIFTDCLYFCISHSSNTYQGDSNFNAIFTPLTFLAAYFNSALNPLMYAFLSRNFRKGMREVLSGIFKRAKSQQSSSLQQRHHHHTLHQHNQHVSTKSEF